MKLTTIESVGVEFGELVLIRFSKTDGAARENIIKINAYHSLHLV